MKVWPGEVIFSAVLHLICFISFTQQSLLLSLRLLTVQKQCWNLGSRLGKIHFYDSKISLKS